MAELVEGRTAIALMAKTLAGLGHDSGSDPEY